MLFCYFEEAQKIKIDFEVETGGMHYIHQQQAANDLLLMGDDELEQKGKGEGEKDEEGAAEHNEMASNEVKMGNLKQF